MIIICNPQTYSTITIYLARVISVQLRRNDENFSLATFIFKEVLVIHLYQFYMN